MAQITHLEGTHKLKEAYPLINGNLDNINNELVGHINSTTAHKAEDITYAGEVIADDVKEAIDKVNERVGTIIAGAGESNTEILDARYDKFNAITYENLGARLDGVSSSLADIVSLKKHTTTQELQIYFNNIPNNTHVQLKGTFELDNVIVISNKKHLKIDLNDAYFHISKHGYGIFEFVNCSNIKIDGGEFEGAGNFYPNTFVNGELNNEKQKCRNEWGIYRNGQLATYEDWNNGKLGNFGIGILIHNNCKNFKVKRVDAHHFNGAGISVGFIGDGYHAEDVVNYCENILISNCECHDNFDCGIQTLQDIATRIENCDVYDNGHPNALITDTNIDPGYGIALRGNLFCSEKTYVYHNRCYRNKRKGLDAHAGKDFVFESNTISDCFYNGIGVTSFGDNPIGDYQILNNTLYNCGNANTAEKFGILANGDSVGIVKGNKLYNCAYNTTLKTNNIAVNAWKGTKVIEDNTIVNSGINYPISASQGLDYVTIKNNKVITDACDIAINVQNDSVSPTKYADVVENNIKATVGKGVRFIYVTDGKCDNNSFNTSLQEFEFSSSSILIGNGNQGIKNMDYTKYKANNGYTIGRTHLVNVNITNGVITFTDASNVVSSIVNLDKGLTVNLKKTLIGGCVFGYSSSSGHNAYQNIYQRNPGSNFIDIGLGTTLGDLGQPSTSVTSLSFVIMFTTL